MNNRIKLSCLIGYTTILLSCGPSADTMNVNEPNSIKNISYPYKFIDNKRELRKNDGCYNEMSLYSCSKQINIDTLKLFCKAKRDSITDGYFHIYTFFNEAKNAVFEEYPVTAGYMDEKNLKNIKAVYTYNTHNGYSKLSVYKDNNWISKPIEFDIK